MTEQFRLPTTRVRSASTVLGTTTSSGTVDRAMMERRRAHRGRELIDAIARIDLCGEPTATTAVMEWVQREYDARQGGALVGAFAVCKLGPPFVDHRLDLVGQICEHFRPEDSVTPPYSAARALVRHPAYAYVEVYSDGSLVPVRLDGTPVEFPRADR